MTNKSDITTIEQIREIGREISAIGNGTYKFPTFIPETIGSLLILHIKYPDDSNS